MTRVLVTGAAGQLGHAMSRLVGPDAVALDRSGLDLTAIDRIGPTVDRLEPEVVVNCAAYTAVDAAESDRSTAHAVNAVAVGELARSCRRVGAKLVTFSTDYVFDGTKPTPYVESDRPAPINVYGATKREGEERALDEDPSALVIRTSWLMSSTHRSFASVILERLQAGEVRVVDDQRGHPTFSADLARGTLAALEAGADGILHLTNGGTASWYEIACEIARLAGIDPGRVRPVPAAEYPTAAARPANSVLDSERRGLLGIPESRDYRESLAETVGELLAESSGSP